MKKLITLLVVISVILSIIPVAYADIAFSDFTKEHWAYNDVMQLVVDGTINGFEDGTFRAESTLTRAQFVKMIGKSNLLADGVYIDVPQSHWAYEYIMASGLEPVSSNLFQPDAPITRDDVVRLLWRRAGEVTGLQVPYMITSQSQTPDAAAYVYTYGIMNGRDYLNLALDTTLTRAEAAAIIVRARAVNADTLKKGFVEIIPEKLLERTYKSFNLFDETEYNPDRKITNGELATAAVRLTSEEYNLSYKGLSVSNPFEHKHSKSLSVIGRYVFDDSVVNAEFIDKNATVKDAISCMTFFTLKRANMPLIYGEKDNYYSGVASVRTLMENVMLTFAKTHGITLYGADTDFNKEITMKEFMAILVQLDGMMGLNSSITVSAVDLAKPRDIKYLKNLEAYPENEGLYQFIAEDIPSFVYTAPFLNLKGEGTGVPVDSFNTAREYKSIFIDLIQRYLKNVSAKSGVVAEVTYYPSLVFNNGYGHTLRVKMKITSVPEGAKLSTAFALAEGVQDVALYQGQEFYADIETGIPVVDIYLPINNVKIVQVM